MACDPGTLANFAACFSNCIPIGEQVAVQTYLLAQSAYAQGAITTLDPSELANLARCFECKIPPGMHLAVQNYILCQLLNKALQQTLLNGLVGYYSFDTDGSDIVGGHTATVGTGSTISIGGIINDYLSCTILHAGASISTVPSDYQLGTGVSFSISMWIKPNLGQNTQAYILSVYDADTTKCSYLLDIAGGKITLVVYCTDGSSASFQPINQPSNAWHHLAFGYDSASKQLWMQLDAGTRFTQSTTADINAGNAPWWLGNSSVSTTFLQGGIDEVAVWRNRVLTQAEVTSIYNGGSCLPLSSYGTIA